MSRVITYSTVFPSYHKRNGEPTHFVEKLITSLVINEVQGYYTTTLKDCRDKGILKISALDDWQKGHTIRAGHRWKVGDWFSPRVWSGKPYQTPMIIIGPDIQIKKIFDLDIHGSDFYIDGKHEMTHPEGWDFDKLAKNDGLTPGDLFDWFCSSPDFKRRKQFFGQILCWDENISY